MQSVYRVGTEWPEWLKRNRRDLRHEPVTVRNIYSVEVGMFVPMTEPYERRMSGWFSIDCLRALMICARLPKDVLVLVHQFLMGGRIVFVERERERETRLSVRL